MSFALIAALNGFPLLMRSEFCRPAELHAIGHRTFAAFTCSDHDQIALKQQIAR